MQINTLLLDNSLWNLLIRFFMNLAVLFVLIGLIYYKFSRKEEFLFSYILIGVMIFLICTILGSVDLQMGLALGLFAIFAIIRFRTVQYSVKDITYVFVIIGVSVINSQANIQPPILGAVIINSSVLILTYSLELFLVKKTMNSMIVIYDKTELLKPGRNRELLKDLSRHTGQVIEKVTIQKVNVKRGNAELEVFFRDQPDE